jgi:hypothetical protein
MPIVLLIIVFAWKKIILSMTDNFPVEIAMVISGLWLENVDDIFQTLVFGLSTEVNFRASFFSLWGRKFFENLAYLLFLTDTWFRFGSDEELLEI